MTDLPVHTSLNTDAKPRTHSPAPPRMDTWQVLQDRILDRIRSGEWHAGDLIPTEQQLSQDYKCARATVNRALRELAERGIIERRRKVGTRVTGRIPTKAALGEQKIRQAITAQGAQYDLHLLSARIAPPPETVQKTMMAPESALTPTGGTGGTGGMIRLALRHDCDGDPYCHEILWVLPQVAPDIHTILHNGQTMTTAEVAAFLTQPQGITRITKTLFARNASDETAAALALDPATAVFRIDRVLWQDSTAAALSQQAFPPDYRLRWND